MNNKLINLVACIPCQDSPLTLGCYLKLVLGKLEFDFLGTDPNIHFKVKEGSQICGKILEITSQNF